MDGNGNTWCRTHVNINRKYAKSREGVTDVPKPSEARENALERRKRGARFADGA